MSDNFLNIGTEDMIAGTLFPVWWGQNRVKHSIPLLSFAEEIDLFLKICGL